MRLGTLQDIRLKYKNQLYFYTIATNNTKMKLRKFNLYDTYLGMNLTKEVQILCIENYKTLLREI